MSIHFRSDSDDWSTPDWVFRFAEQKYGPFTIDLCASAENAKCPRYYDIEADALKQDWGDETGLLNHPYSRKSGGAYVWLGKAREASQRGATIVCITPARPETRAWIEHVRHASEVIFIGGRLKFGDATEPAPFPSALVIFAPPVTCPGPAGITYVMDATSKPAFSYLIRKGQSC